ncbi:ABC transporter permease [Mangrovibacillus cuniculi]|uniref:ABC transporter permease n=1 Tax=Mangrovibacillus cuniculi TaxID=2593652 RepID=A0A7S8C980_9BACI|nr:ABC transporter permease subunit [Mangrovibacillus cuniculi]QPC45687.1 ABC transporter permease [Mangrovibacillus cuniculi]
MLLNIFKKELKDSFSDRRTLLLTVFLPIVMMTGLVFFYESLMAGHDEEKTYELAVPSTWTEKETILFSSNNAIELVPSKNVENAVVNGDAQAGVMFSVDFLEQIQNGQSGTVEIVGDSFSQNSAMLMGIVSETLAAYEEQVVADRLKDQSLDTGFIQPITVNQRELTKENPGVNMIAILIPLILSIAIGVGAAPAAADLFAGEKERKTMEALLMTPVNRLTLLTAKWLTISTIGTVIGVITLLVVGLEIMFMTEHLKQAVSYEVGAVPLVFIAVVISAIYSMFTASILMLTSILGKTVKEAGSYGSPVMMISMFPFALLINTGVNELQTIHFLIPFMNLFSILKELCLGIIHVPHILLMIGSNLILIAILFIISRILFSKDKWVVSSN